MEETLTPDGVADEIGRRRLAAVVRYPDGGDLVQVLATLHEAGIRIW